MVHIYPWLWIQASVVGVDLYRKRITLDTLDIALCVASFMAIYLTAYKSFTLFAVLGILVFLVAKIEKRGAHFRNPRPRFGWADHEPGFRPHRLGFGSLFHSFSMAHARLSPYGPG